LSRRYSACRAGDQQRPTLLETRFFEFDYHRPVYLDGLYQLDRIETPAGAKLLGRRAELIAKGAGEGLVRSVSGVERDGEDIGRARRKFTRSFRETPPSDVAHDRLAGRSGECSRHVETRDPRIRRDIVERNFLAKPLFNKPDGFFDRIHIGPCF
jgi:hypothetical protein